MYASRRWKLSYYVQTATKREYLCEIIKGMSLYFGLDVFLAIRGWTWEFDSGVYSGVPEDQRARLCPVHEILASNGQKPLSPKIRQRHLHADLRINKFCFQTAI
jgi:hypothetical protein